jgi:hypothetical protein
MNVRQFARSVAAFLQRNRMALALLALMLFAA